MGFSWDDGGYANFEGGKLKAKASLRFHPSTDEIRDYLIGDKQISSTDKKLRAAKPAVEDMITVFMR
jgi:ribosomal protein L17